MGMAKATCKVLGKGLRLFTLLTLTLLLRHILTRPSTSILIMTSLLVLLNSNPLETSNCLPLVNSMQLQCSLGLGSCLLGNVPRGVEEKLASYAIWDFNIFLWVIRKSTLEANCLMYLCCFCYTKSSFSNIISRLNFCGACGGKLIFKNLGTEA